MTPARRVLSLSLFALALVYAAWFWRQGEWFAHGVMVAWTRPPERGFALFAVLLSLAIVLAASIPGLRRRFARK